MSHAEPAAPAMRAIDPRFMLRVFQGFVALAVITLLLSFAGRMAGQAISRGGHSASADLREIVVGNDVLNVPENAIRFENQRHDGVARRLDLYLHWPEMAGYSDAERDDFNNLGGNASSILFLSFDERVMSRDMSGRFEPIYRTLIAEPGEPGEGGVMFYGFRPDSGYLDEVLAVGEGGLVARCMAGPEAADALAPCERDIHAGEGLSLTYRFPRELLGDWPALEAAVRAKAAEFLAPVR